MRFLFGLVLGMTLLAGVVSAQTPVNDEDYERALHGLVELMNQKSDSMEPYLQAMAGEAAEKFTLSLKESRAKGGKAKALSDKDIERIVKAHTEVLDEKFAPLIAELRKTTIETAAKEYRAIFTRQEIVDMYAYHMSPSGKSSMAKLPLLMQRLTPLMSAQREQIDRFMKENIKDIVAESIKRSGVSI